MKSPSWVSGTKLAFLWVPEPPWASRRIDRWVDVGAEYVGAEVFGGRSFGGVGIGGFLILVVAG